MDMKVLAHIGSRGMSAEFSLNGTCPFCLKKSVFVRRDVVKQRSNREGWAHWNLMMQCQGCFRFILASLLVKEPPPEKPDKADDGQPEWKWEFEYEAHYPVALPNDSVAAEIPEQIAADFSEALRSNAVRAFNATVEMCRRALEASCLELGAKPKHSITQKIDWVYKQGKIDKTLRNVAHEIRLGGNRGSHPALGERPISEDEATAVLEFTRHYFDHVDVVESQLGKYDFSKGGRRTEISPAEGSPMPSADSAKV